MGYIGSHTAVTLIEAGHEVTLFDNLSNSDSSVLQSIEKITGKKITFIEGDIRDIESLSNTLKKYRKFIKRFKVPRFPITGNFLMKKGFKQGLELGKKLDFLKNYWIKNNFKLNLKNI
ncbi:MAG: NAD-dependent epimerase/dehydratase family protein [Proteobacteria bacterium]|nr:NAD-dependent epimerase/dehydratase family protein [Pseudomonadota bacterium]